jgi:hypothetical protein
MKKKVILELGQAHNEVLCKENEMSIADIEIQRFYWSNLKERDEFGNLGLYMRTALISTLQKSDMVFWMELNSIRILSDAGLLNSVMNIQAK